jgi:hypothetical protein
MANNMQLTKLETLESKLISIDNQLVLLDKEIANLYEIEPKKLRQQVKRNIDKFPSDYAFKLTKEQFDIMVSQNVIPSKKEFGGSLPYVFTEKDDKLVYTKRDPMQYIHKIEYEYDDDLRRERK